MQTGDILTLDYNEKYLLLNKVNSNNKNYFLAVGVTQDEKDIDMDDITFFEEILENNEVFVQEVYNEELLDTLSDASMLISNNEAKKMEKILENYYKNKE